jgi:hypothetical protein
VDPQREPAKLGALEGAADVGGEVGHAVDANALAHEPEQAVPTLIASLVAAVLECKSARECLI